MRFIAAMLASLIFFPESEFFERPEAYGLPYDEVRVVTSDGVGLHGWYLPAEDARATILMLHGNAGNISHRLFKTAPLVKAGVSVLLIDYRGFGKSEGKIARGEDLVQDGRAALQWLIKEKQVPAEQIVLFGESIGSGPVLLLANERSVGGVILEAPFTKLSELGKKHYPFLPSFLVKEFEFDNRSVIKSLTAPLLIIHGTDDEICPFAMGQELFDTAPEPKELYAIAGAHHNDVVEIARAEYFDRIVRFLQ